MTDRAVVFDFGAVLFRWQPAELLQQVVPDLAPDAAAAQRLARQIFQAFTPDSDWAQFDLGLIEAPALAARIGARIGADAAAVQRIIDAIPAHLQALPDSVALLQQLQAAGHRLFYLSNMPRAYADHLERSHAFLSAFADGLFSSRVGLMKPDTALFARAEQQFDLRPAQTLFFDDNAANIAAAQARGWQAVLFDDASRCTRQARQLGWL